MVGVLTLLISVVASAEEGAEPAYVEEEVYITAPSPRPESSDMDVDVKLQQPMFVPDEMNEPNDKELVPKSTTVILDEGFEGTFPGNWTVTGDGGVYWDDTFYRPHFGSWSVWCADGGANGQPAGGNYLNDMETWLRYGPFNLSDAVAGSVSFWLWNDSEFNFDFIKWMVSINGVNYSGIQLSGTTNGWVQKTIDFTNVPGLGDVTGNSNVWIAFIFESDVSNTGLGAYIDDVVITKTVSGGCTPSLTTMCLQNNRFEVGIDYRFTNNTTGDARVATSGTADSGLFYYTNPDNWEFLIKILNGCTINNHYWVFFAATTNQEFTVTVRDTYTNQFRTYFNPLRQSADAVTDTEAFATCP